MPVNEREREAGADSGPTEKASPDSGLQALPPPNAWCREPWRGLDAHTCILGDGDDLLIYLPGIMPPEDTSPQKENVERVVAAAAGRAKAAALLPRGRRGIGPKDAKDWWAWPTTPADTDALAEELVAEWKLARAAYEKAVGHPFAKVYLAGSSSGAYFLTALALRGVDLAIDGFAAASGGAPTRPIAPKKRPFYVGYGTGDPTNSGPKALGELLKASGWKARVAEHPGGHGAREVYLDEAFAFWRAP